VSEPVTTNSSALQPELVAEVTSPVIAETKPVEEPSYFEYLGDNNKYILILVSEPKHQYIEPKELETLTNILKGKKQELKDVAIVNLQKYPTATFGALRKFFVCSSVVMFGVDPAQIKIDGLKLNRVSDFQGSKVLATYRISEMLTDVEKKRAFWDEMKKL
jgi:hypothetical protein